MNELDIDTIIYILFYYIILSKLLHNRVYFWEEEPISKEYSQLNKISVSTEIIYRGELRSMFDVPSLGSTHRPE